MALAVGFLGGAALGFQDQKTVSAEGLIYDLRHPDPERKKEAARLLGRNKIRTAVPALIDVSSDPDDDVRLAVVKALVEINDSRALQAYIDRLEDRKEAIQKKAIEGIIDIYVTEEGGFIEGVGKAVSFFNPLSDDFDPRMVEPYVPVSQKAIDGLAALLEHSDDDVREEAAKALGILRANSALPSIRQALTREDDNDVKVELIRSAYKIGDPAAGPELVPLIEDDNKKVHDEAIFAAGRLGINEAVPILTELLDVKERRKVFGVIPASGEDDLQKRAFIALARIGDERSESLFINRLNDPRDLYRRYAAEGLGRIGHDNVATDIAKLHLREQDGEVKLAMSFALYQMGRSEHLVALIDNVDKDQGFHYLLELQPGEVGQLFDYVRTEPKAKKVRLLEVIGLRGDASHLDRLEPYTRSNDPQVMSAATMAMRRIRGREG